MPTLIPFEVMTRGEKIFLEGFVLNLFDDDF